MAIRERKGNKSPEARHGSGKKDWLKDTGLTSEVEKPRAVRQAYYYARLVVTLVGFLTRFARLSFPREVVFDEVHFGKFASFYLEGTYFFDLHPPFAKLLIAAVGRLLNYGGAFKFDNIGEPYPHDVPYVAYRCISATEGTLCVWLAFSVMEECGFSVAACTLTGLLIALDNAQILHSRLILLDCTLLFALMLSLYCYVRFVKLRSRAFSRAWFGWLAATGFALSMVMSTKFVGLFAFLTVGASVIAELWKITDIRSGNSLGSVFKHFSWRAVLLIAAPFLYFLFWFYVHFAVLTQSGPGDNFMSTRFQAGLSQSDVAKNAYNVYYYDMVTIKSRCAESAFLHSHFERYPRQYPDGRISSAGQQVTAYLHPDANNKWQIVPLIEVPEQDRGRIPLIGRQTVRLYHPTTDSYLLAHDVASPSYPAYEEVTTVTGEEAEKRFNETLFELGVLGDPNQQVVTGITQFFIRHVKTNVFLWQATNRLPDWGFKQFEVNGPKRFDKGNSQQWVFDSIEDIDDEKLKSRAFWPDAGEGKAASRRMPFWDSYVELQGVMFRSNNNLMASHPYASRPQTWPFLLVGVSYWTDKTLPRQIYLTGNYAGWFLELMGYVMFVVLVVVDQFCTLRGIKLLNAHTRTKLYHTVLWFFAGWAFHYVPFFFMGRQLFLHHYLPAHMLGALVAGGVADILLGEQETNSSHLRVNLAMKIFMVMSCVALVWMFWWTMPLTYGAPLTPDQIAARQVFNVRLHFGK